MVFNEDSQDIDFRVESNGNANMLFVDGGNDRVGVGTASPTGTLTVNLGTDKNVSYSGSVGEVGSVPCLFLVLLMMGVLLQVLVFVEQTSDLRLKQQNVSALVHQVS